MRIRFFQGKENLVLPLVILGAISVIGGVSGLRLPETLHHRLPQTMEEGELFGKNWTCADCIRCIPTKYTDNGLLIMEFLVRKTLEFYFDLFSPKNLHF